MPKTRVLCLRRFRGFAPKNPTNPFKKGFDPKTHFCICGAGFINLCGLGTPIRRPLRWGEGGCSGPPGPKPPCGFAPRRGVCVPFGTHSPGGLGWLRPVVCGPSPKAPPAGSQGRFAIAGLFFGLHQMAGHEVARDDLLQPGLGLLALVAGPRAAAGKVAALGCVDGAGRWGQGWAPPTAGPGNRGAGCYGTARQSWQAPPRCPGTLRQSDR